MLFSSQLSTELAFSVCRRIFGRSRILNFFQIQWTCFEWKTEDELSWGSSVHNAVGYFTGGCPPKPLVFAASRQLSPLSCGCLFPVPQNSFFLSSSHCEWEGAEASRWKEEAVGLSSSLCVSLFLWWCFTELSIIMASADLLQNSPLLAVANSRYPWAILL